MSKLGVGILGCGKISGIYLQNLTGRFADDVEVVACADVMLDAAKARAAEYHVAKACSPEELLADRRVQLVLNLTPAPAHYHVTMQILRAGKHLYTEKPLALSMDEGREIVATAKAKNLRVSCAPDTILGGGIQTCRKLIDDGAIGSPVAAQAFVSLSARGERYMTVFRGPLLDMAPYFVGAMALLLGPVRSVSGVAQPARQRAGGEQLSPAAITIEAPGNAAAVLEFENGCLGTMNATVESTGYMPALKIWGTDGVLTVPDPNTFGGPVILQRRGDKAPQTVELTHGLSENSRGIGAADLARGLAKNEPHRLSAELALHELEIMLAVIASSKSGQRVTLETRCDRPAPMPVEGAAK
jgi:predicted dehydrogenase